MHPVGRGGDNNNDDDNDDDDDEVEEEADIVIHVREPLRHSCLLRALDPLPT